MCLQVPSVTDIKYIYKFHWLPLYNIPRSYIGYRYKIHQQVSLVTDINTPTSSIGYRYKNTFKFHWLPISNIPTSSIGYRYEFAVYNQILMLLVKIVRGSKRRFNIILPTYYQQIITLS